ncbi:MAG: carboxylesterase family protein [Chitinophagaceae bacterium]|nr:carboxylesterase family protein [Chitinophagaceae bacterium]
MRSLLIIFVLPLFVKAQNCRYNERIFPSVDKTSNISYGNAPAITSFYISEATTFNQTLLLDLFQPTGDTATRRAVIIFAHSGGFINGTKDNEDMQALCDSFAHRGYVTASLDYRLNFNLLSSSSSERAVWRGIQDASAAVRFFKQNASLYRLDTNKIFFWGSSAGAFMSVGLAYMDNAERPASTYSAFLQPDLGCKDCTGNAYAHSSTVKGIISCWGATKDTAWIQNNNNIPSLLFHGSGDGTVPFTEGYPFGLPTITYVRGSQQLNEQLNRTSVYHEFYPETGLGHEYWGTSNGTFIAGGPTPYYASIISKARLFMLGRMGAPVSCGPLPIVLADFKGTYKDERIDLQWITSTENNLKEIVVERSLDAVNFESLSVLAPAGYNGSGAGYQSIDPRPFSGTSFYRLRFNDRDGRFTYSPILKLSTPEKEWLITRTYPVPVHDRLNLQIQSGKGRRIGLAIYDMAGRQWKTSSYDLSSGLNNLQLPFIDMPSGVYLVRLTDELGKKPSLIRIVKE